MAAPRSLLALLDRLRAYLERQLERYLGETMAAVESKTPTATINLLDPLLGAQELVQLTVAIAAANARLRLSQEKLLVRDCILFGGPRADGTTVNTSTLYVGNAQVSAANGAPVVAGGALTLGLVDLSEVYVVGATATDLLRILYKPV